MLAGPAARLGARSPQRQPAGRERGNRNASGPGRKASSGRWLGPVCAAERPQSAARANPASPQKAARTLSMHRTCWKALIFELCGFAAKNAKHFLRKRSKNAAAVPLRRRRARAATYVLFMCAPGGVFSRRQVFRISGFLHTAPFAIRAGFGKNAKQRKQQHMLMVFVFSIVSCEQLWAHEIAEGQLGRNQGIFQEERAAAPRANRGCR